MLRTRGFVRNNFRDKRKLVVTTAGKNPGNVFNKNPKAIQNFVAITQERQQYLGPHPKCNKCRLHHQIPGKCPTCHQCKQLGHKIKNCPAGTNNQNRGNVIVQAGNSRACYGCGSSDHFRNTCPKLNCAPGNNGNQARGRAFMIGANEAQQDPNVVTGTFPIHNHYASILLDTRADKCVVFSEFASLIDLEPTKMNDIYIVELANGKLIEANDIVQNCTLNSNDHFLV
jgi:hypothetical protein